jgi:hypothetical protein
MPTKYRVKADGPSRWVGECKRDGRRWRPFLVKRGWLVFKTKKAGDEWVAACNKVAKRVVYFMLILMLLAGCAGVKHSSRLEKCGGGWCGKR